MKKSIPLKEIVGFLPYGLKMVSSTEGRSAYDRIEKRRLKKVEEAKCSNIDFLLFLNRKPAVRPLSDLTKEITHNGEIIKPYEILFPVDEFDKLMDWTSLWCAEEFLKVEDKSELCYPIEFWEKLKELHFDIYDWIKDGLAVSINDL